MENKRPITTILSLTAVILSLAAFIICMILNFQEFLMGSLVTTKNVIVTFSYLTIWILTLIIGIIIKNHGIVRYCSAFWIITLFIATLTVYINATGNTADWALPLVVLFLGQWYGIGFFVSSIIAESIIIALISLVILVITHILLKHTKSS